MELQVGQYVRTKKGIFQIRNKDVFIEDKKQYIGVNGRYTCIDIETIEKASHNIIDLIEFGDYVNGVLINYKDKEGVYHTAFDCEDEVHFTNPEDIKTILTKEQYEANAYEVKHENN